MEIKKGISQMAEYPNVEINYVMSKDGRMYYVLKEGILPNGCVIATLDPKYAIDETNPSGSVGVFSESGETLIDFDKKSIKGIANELVLVVNSRLNTPEVIGISGKEDDPMISKSVNESKESITTKVINEMGTSGEIIFSDPYSEANVYRLDTYNNKVGIDCSLIGKNETSLFFHTNDSRSETDIIEVEDFSKEENVVVEDAEENNESEELKLDISQDLLSGFNIPEEDLAKVSNQNDTKDEVVEEQEDSEENETTEEEVPTEDSEDAKEDTDDSENAIEEKPSEKINLNIEAIPEEEDKNSEPDSEEDEQEIDINESDKDETLDNAIEVIDKMIKETSKLKQKISDLEEQLKEKEKIIKESESKKDELNEILDKANEVLEEIK